MKNRFLLTVLSGLVSMAGLGVIPASAQVATGTLSGRVVIASSGDPVHGATIIVVGARRQTTSADDGTYKIENVPAGAYEVVVQREQLSTTRQSVLIAAGETAVLDFKLSVGIHEEVTVTASATGASTAFESFNSITTVSSNTIAKRVGATLADVLLNEPGIAKRTFGPGSSRPIIRGFDGDRVLVMQDGVRTGDLSSQSGDHGVSIDPAGLSRIEVVKGPATLLYGSNAIGGVVNAITPQEVFRTNPFTGTLAGVSIDGGSANAQAGAAANIQHGRGALLFYGNLTARRTGDYDAPNETIPNSATRLVTGEGGFLWNGPRAFFGLSGGVERNRYGVPFAGLLEGEEDALIDLEVKRQNVRFDTGIRNVGGRFVDAVRIKGSYLDYQHDELEMEDGVESLGTRFNNNVFTVRTEMEQPSGRRLTGRIGAEFLRRDYESVGAEALAPATTQSSVAAFLYEEVAMGKHRLQFGGRVERVGYDADFEDGKVERSFTAVSGSIGAHASVGGNSALVVNLTGASRAPALEELFNFGPHPGNLAFEIGDPNLKIERTLGLDASLRTRSSRARAEVNVFTYRIKNFVFLDVTDDVEDGLAVANYVQGNSRFSGVDGTAHLDISERVELTAGVSFVRAKLTGTNESLPRIPPVQARLEVGFGLGQFSISPEVVLTARQDKVFRFETPTNGWVTGNLSVTWQRSEAHRSHLIALQAYNLANRTYRLHTSFLKQLAPEMGRGIKATYTVRFF